MYELPFIKLNFKQKYATEISNNMEATHSEIKYGCVSTKLKKLIFTNIFFYKNNVEQQVKFDTDNTFLYYSKQSISFHLTVSSE